MKNLTLANKRVVAIVWVLASVAAVQSGEVDFERDVLPGLQQHCIDCHGPDAAESNLRLDSVVGALRGGDSGEPAVVPGKSGQSYLMTRVLSKDPGQRMPPDSPPLPQEQVDRLRAWIDDVRGWRAAEAELAMRRVDHWSFQPIRSITPPPSNDPLVANPIDAFVLRKLTETQLRPSPQAERLTRIRRLFLVMHGLPPTRQQIRQFLEDDSPDAWRSLVERVLDSPRYGERWARHWLDLIRFGETHGFETNRERPNAWPFRDYVIESLNADKPYDQFVREQIAGDAIGEPIGTGFLVAGPYDLVKGGGNLAAMQRMNELDDMINTTGTTFLGLTLGCARCHNHKFDPVTQTDYYSLQAIFAGVNHGNRTLPVPTDIQEKIAALDHEIAELTQRLARFIPKDSEEAEQGKKWLARIDTARKEKAKLQDSTKVYVGTFSQPGVTHRLYRGEPDQRREVVGPDAVAALTSLALDNNAPEQQRRLALAEWIASKENPLTARVIVNRLWQHHFGTGLVDTPSDFGANGTPPSHPELLDWLAAELISNGWSLKHVHHLILMSHTWQQDSRPRDSAFAVDSSSRLLWRFPPRRLEAEVLRDSILAVTGVLDLRAGGPGFSGFKVQPENVRHYFPKESYGPDDWRRMVYMTKVRQEQESVFGAFDCPDASQVVPKRSRSTTPLQAFNLFNSTFVQQQAELFARRLDKESPQADAHRAALAFELAFGRPATTQEAADGLAFATEHGWPALCRALLNANEFVFVP